ncbi:hypothetical protein BED03_22560 [Escherichia coli]|nr:hypothetical protein [Escherichia coli]
MTALNKQALRLTAEKAKDNFMPNFMVPTRDVLALLDDLEAKDKQIDYLKAIAAHSNAGWKEAHEQEARAEAAEKRIAELEAREISLPEHSSMLQRADFHDDYQTVMAYKVYEVIAAIRAAGIRIKGE